MTFEEINQMINLTMAAALQQVDHEIVEFQKSTGSSEFAKSSEKKTIRDNEIQTTSIILILIMKKNQ